MKRFIKKIALVGVIIGALFVLWYAKIIAWDIPLLVLHNPKHTSLMSERGKPVSQKWVALPQISKDLQRGVLAAEDATFFEHNGIDFYEMRQAMKKNIKKGSYARGGSTITMQLAKNLYFSSKKTLLRKILEIIAATRMEHVLSKSRILEIYLNVVEWGRGIYGIEAASQHYFRASAANLSKSQAAFLAAILPNPRQWGKWPPGPYVSKRRDIILARMQSFQMPFAKTEHKKIVREKKQADPEQDFLKEIPEEYLEREEVFLDE